MSDSVVDNIRQKLAGHATTLHHLNMVLGFMSVLMMFSCTFSYTFVDNYKSRYLSTLQRLPWLTLWSHVDGETDQCMGLGLTSFYSGPCGIAPTGATTYATLYDTLCQPIRDIPDPKLMQSQIHQCDMYDSCVYSGDWVLGMSIMGFLSAVGATAGSYLRAHRPSGYSARVTLLFSLATCIFAFTAFVSFYHCGNKMEGMLRETWSVNAVKNTDATLRLGGAGICAMLVWLFFIYATLVNFFLGTTDRAGDGSDGGLNAPFADGDTSAGYRVEDTNHNGDMRGVSANAEGDFSVPRKSQV
jgi:hypothetical protein